MHIKIVVHIVKCTILDPISIYNYTYYSCLQTFIFWGVWLLEFVLDWIKNRFIGFDLI